MPAAPATVLDAEASRRCLQSGTVALVLAVVACALAGYWHQARLRAALGHYINDRNALSEAVRSVASDPYWVRYTARHGDADLISVSALERLAVLTSASGSAGASAPRRSSSGRPGSPPGGRPGGRGARPGVPSPPPAPPTGLSIAAYERIPGARSLGSDLEALSDPRLLERSMEASDFFAFSIQAWGDRRNHLMYQNYASGRCHVSRFDIPRSRHAGDFVPTLDPAALLGCLTLRDARALAAYEMPVFGNPLERRDRLAVQVGLSGSALNVNLPFATVALDVAVAFVMLFFAAFTAEAIAQPSFPAPCTLFGAFGRTALSATALRLALWTPLAACSYLAVCSGSWPLCFGLLLPALATYPADRSLRRVGYFSRGRRRPALPARGRGRRVGGEGRVG